MLVLAATATGAFARPGLAATTRDDRNVVRAPSLHAAANPDVAPVEMSAPLAPQHQAEPAWIALVMVVVFLSVLRAGFQLRDNADARLKERANALGL